MDYFYPFAGGQPDNDHWQAQADGRSILNISKRVAAGRSAEFGTGHRVLCTFYALASREPVGFKSFRRGFRV